MDVDYDSSGTDDDLPPPRQNRMLRGCFSGNGKSAGMSSFPYPRIHEESDMEGKIHQLEREAYFSVLRAFKAQADALSWDKEGLITELRKELRLSNEEHSELLRRANGDETIRRIREWRKSSGLPQTGAHSSAQAVRDPVPSPSVSASRKKQKRPSSMPSQSFAGPSPSFHPQTMVGANQPPSTSAKRGPIMGPKGKKHISMPPGSSAIHPGSVGRGQYGNRLSSGAQASEPAQGAFDPLVGRKVKTRWPEDNNFYEAVITDYKPDEGRHALVYDMGTENETWEWVNLSEISPNDIQWDGEDPRISHYGYHGEPGHGRNGPFGRCNIAGSGKGRGIITKDQSRKNIPPLRNGLPNKGPGDFQLLNTDTVIREVERVFSSSQPDPAEVENAKRVVKEHEQALVYAISRLGDLSDVESDEDGHFLHRQTMDRR